jgi:hypothetical protein
MGLPDFTPRLIELQAQVAKLTHDRELLIKALEDLMEASPVEIWPYQNAIVTLKKVTK